jgi:hypothetical protein
MPTTASMLGVRNSFDPRENIDGGVRHLRGLMDRFPLPLAIAAYNAGERAVVPEVEHKEGEEFHKLTLTEKAMERLAVETAPVREEKVEGAAEGGAARLVVPYSALIYVADGSAFVYTSPAPRVFLRQPVEVDYIEGDTVVLKSGPPPGTQVASVGATELFGTEFGVGH